VAGVPPWARAYDGRIRRGSRGPVGWIRGGSPALSAGTDVAPPALSAEPTWLRRPCRPDPTPLRRPSQGRGRLVWSGQGHTRWWECPSARAFHRTCHTPYLTHEAESSCPIFCVISHGFECAGPHCRAASAASCGGAYPQQRLMLRHRGGGRQAGDAATAARGSSVPAEACQANERAVNEVAEIEDSTVGDAAAEQLR